MERHASYRRDRAILPPINDPDRTLQKPGENRHDGRIAGAMVAIGGGLMVAGSLLPWASYQVMFSIYDSSGLEIGYGVLTLLLGLGLGVIGLRGARFGGLPRFQREATASALVGLIAVLAVAAVLQLQHADTEPESSVFVLGRGFGLYMAGIGAAIATIGSFRMRVYTET